MHTDEESREIEDNASVIFTAISELKTNGLSSAEIRRGLLNKKGDKSN